MPGGIVELDEDPRETVRREVLEETGVTVEPGQLTGVYKGMRLGFVSLVFRCRPLSGAARPTAEATEVAWLDNTQVTGRMAEAFAIRLTDALEAYEPYIRIHDGQRLLSWHSKQCACLRRQPLLIGRLLGIVVAPQVPQGWLGVDYCGVITLFRAAWPD